MVSGGFIAFGDDCEGMEFLLLCEGLVSLICFGDIFSMLDFSIWGFDGSPRLVVP